MSNLLRIAGLFLLCGLFCSLPSLQAEPPTAQKKKGAVIWKGYPNGYMNRLKSSQAGSSNGGSQRSTGTNPAVSPGQRSFEIDQAEKMQELHSKLIRSLIPR
jgi:hypothetical protein